MLNPTDARPKVTQGEVQIPGDRKPTDRSYRRERRLWHRPQDPIGALGCEACPEKNVCGGLRLNDAVFDCLQFCCGSPASCDRVCRNHPDFADRVREVQTFCFDTVPRAPVLKAPTLPHVIPVVYHGKRRSTPIASATIALPLYLMFDRRSGQPRYDSNAALCESFGIRSGSTILLTGTDRDPPLERWWGLGEIRRREIIRSLRSIGIGLVTTPNYSLFIDRPRWDDLHAMKRIAIAHQEFLSEGLPAALHVNGRTEADFGRWTDHVGEREEISHLAYEFTTGTGWAGRKELHAEWLAGLATQVGRPLHLVVRGGVDVLPVLQRSFASVSLLDTTIFMKTMMRQSAYRKETAALGWKLAPTDAGAPLDMLFAQNCRTMEMWLGERAILSP